MNYIFNQQHFPFQQPSAFFTQQTSSSSSSQGNTDSNNIQHYNAPPKQKKKTSSILATKNLIRERLLRKIKSKNGVNSSGGGGGGAKGEMRQSNFEAASKALSQALFLPMSSSVANSQSFVFSAGGNASSTKKSGSFDAFQTWINYDDEGLIGGAGCNANAHISCTSPASAIPIINESNQLDLNGKLNTLSGGHLMGNSTSMNHSWWGNSAIGGGCGNLPVNSLETFTDNSCCDDGNGNKSNNSSSTNAGYYEMLQNPVFFEEFMSAAMSNSGSNSTLYYKNASLDLFQ